MSSKKLNGEFSPCLAGTRTFFYKQIISSESCKSSQTKRTFKIFHYINCKNKYRINLVECDLCKIRNVGKIETLFNIRLISLRKNVKNPNAIPADKHFTWPGHNFNNHAKFTLNEMLTNTKLQ